MTKLQKLAQLELARRAIARELAEEEMERVAGGGANFDGLMAKRKEEFERFLHEPRNYKLFEEYMTARKNAESYVIEQ